MDNVNFKRSQNIPEQMVQLIQKYALYQVRCSITGLPQHAGNTDISGEIHAENILELFKKFILS